MSQPSRLLTAAQVAERLSMTTGAVYRAIERGQIPAIRIGERRVRVDARDLERLIEQGRQESPAA